MERIQNKAFCFTFYILGFSLDKTVQIPEYKKAQYLSKLEPWTAGQKFSKKDAESILGTLVHCSLAVPVGRSHLHFMASFNFFSSSFVRRSLNSGVLSDINWWWMILSSEFCGSVLSRLLAVSPIPFWVDASSSYGIGVIFGSQWDSWTLQPGWDKDGHNIGWAEFVAIELGLLFAIHNGYLDTHFSIKSNNHGVIHAIIGGRSRSPQQNSVLQCITLLLSHYKLWISSSYVPSLDNLADLPSRGLPLPNHTRAPTTFALPDSLCPFLLHSPLVT